MDGYTELHIINTPLEDTFQSVCFEELELDIDDDLGLPLVNKETIVSKYGIVLDPSNSFHRSLQEFFDRTGFLTKKQLSCIKI